MSGITFYILCGIVFAIQFILCFRATKRHIRLLPVYLHLIGILLAVEWYFDIFDIHTGWDELGAVIIGVIILCSGGAAVLAWLVYYAYNFFKKKSAPKTE